MVDTNFLVHSYTIPAQQFGYTYIQDEITEIDRSKRRVHTAQGYIDYDWLVISGGIRYGYEAWFGNDRKAAYYAASRCGAHVIEAEIPLPLPNAAVLLRAVAGKLNIRTKLAIFDHIASHSALLLPAAELTRLAHRPSMLEVLGRAASLTGGQVGLSMAATIEVSK